MGWRNFERAVHQADFSCKGALKRLKTRVFFICGGGIRSGPGPHCICGAGRSNTSTTIAIPLPSDGLAPSLWIGLHAEISHNSKKSIFSAGSPLKRFDSASRISRI